jgi:hypothetical protein
VADGVLVVRSLHFEALNVLALREVDDLLLNLVKFFLVHAQALHHYRGLRVDILTEHPRCDSEINATVLEHIQDPVKDLLVE